MKGTTMGFVFLIFIFVIMGVMVPTIFITADNETVINMSNSTYAPQYKAVQVTASVWQYGQYYIALIAGIMLLLIIFIMWLHKPMRRRF